MASYHRSCAPRGLSACGFVDFDTVQFSICHPDGRPAAVTVFLDLPDGLGILPGLPDVCETRIQVKQIAKSILFKR